MNPLRWTREHQIAWFVISLLGAVLGLMMDYIHSPFFSLLRRWQVEVPLGPWLEADWPWALVGFVATACVFYAVQLFRTSN